MSNVKSLHITYWKISSPFKADHFKQFLLNILTTEFSLSKVLWYYAFGLQRKKWEIYYLTHPNTVYDIIWGPAYELFFLVPWIVLSVKS